jgi:hypothetical protein
MAEPLGILALVGELRGASPANLAPRAARALNERYADLLVSAWEVEPPGRLRAALRLPAARAAAARASEMSFELLLRTHPRPLALGLGLAPEVGLATRRARDAAESAGRLRVFAQAHGFDETLDEPGLGLGVGGAWTAVGALVAGWTERQAQFARWLLRDGVLDWRREPARFVPERRRKEVAQAFGVSPSVVTESLQAADVASFRHGVWAAAWQLHAAGRPRHAVPAAREKSESLRQL